MTTGLCHYVYKVKTSKQTFVARLCTKEKQHLFRGYQFWTNELQGKVPIPRILDSSVKEDFSYLILEHINGTDLGNCISQMNHAEKENVVEHLISYLKIAHSLQEAKGYGWALNYECPQLKSSWRLVITEALSRAREWISSVGKVDLSYVDSVEVLLPEFEEYIKGIRPKAFFHDLTTKNLLIDDRLSVAGFVDIDEMAFGDHFFHLSLMNMALLANDHSNDLVDIWLDKLEANRIERKVMLFYTLIHCVTFMGENGKFFNKPSVFDNHYQSKLNVIFQSLITEMESI